MYAIYARQSLEKKDSISIEMQIDLCSRLVPDERRKEIFTDIGYTGTNTKRPAYKRMLEQVKKGNIECIIAYKLDRISRSLIDFAKLSDVLDNKNVKLISYSEQIDTRSPMGQMLVRLLIMFAEMEQKTISARISDNYLARAEMGKPLGGIKPYGYEDDWKIDSREAEIVGDIYSSLMKGRSFDSIAVSLNSRNVKSPGGNLWTGTQISRILRNPIYVQGNRDVLRYLSSRGKLLHPENAYCTGKGSMIIERKDGLHIAAGSHKGIIPAEMWLAAQDIILRRKPSSNSGSGKKSWLQGLVLCGKCGSPCYVRGSGNSSEYVYFVCRGKRKGVCEGIHAVRIHLSEEYAGRMLEEEIKRLLLSAEENSEEDRELNLMTGGTYIQRRKTGFHSFIRLDFQQKKAAAKLLIKNVIVTEDQIQVVLR
ncbi:MAG: recombinase family protein [Oscillospiraceae bacterium]|nr:recombinase family protein [Oscillospiraceae bacterium]